MQHCMNPSLYKEIKKDRLENPNGLFWRERVGIEPTYAATNYNYWF